MAFVRGRLGIEYNTTPSRDADGGIPKGFLVCAACAMLLILAATSIVRRYSGSKSEELLYENAAGKPSADAKPQAQAAAKTEQTPPSPVQRSARKIEISPSRSPRLAQLLDKLNVAESTNDTILAIATIEEIRRFPGGAAADLDDRLARRLGELNLKRLWELKNQKWVSDVTVRPGENATRIARAHGTTVNAIKKLNPSTDINRLKHGFKIKVMHIPRFILVVHLRMKTADLQLNGKFFKRYDLTDVKDAAKPGSYETKYPLSGFLAGHGIALSPNDMDELDTLVPHSSILVVSEM